MFLERIRSLLLPSRGLPEKAAEQVAEPPRHYYGLNDLDRKLEIYIDFDDENFH